MPCPMYHHQATMSVHHQRSCHQQTVKCLNHLLTSTGLNLLHHGEGSEEGNNCSSMGVRCPLRQNYDYHILSGSVSGAGNNLII